MPSDQISVKRKIGPLPNCFVVGWSPLVNTKKHILKSVLLIKNSGIYQLSLNTEPLIIFTPNSDSDNFPLNGINYVYTMYQNLNFLDDTVLHMLYFVTTIFANVNFKKFIIYGVNFSALLIKQKWLVVKLGNLTSSSLRSLASPISELLRATTLAAPDFIVIAFDLRFLSLNRFFLKYLRSISIYFKDNLHINVRFRQVLKKNYF